MEPRPSATLDRVSPSWKIFLTDAAEKAYILELQIRDRLMKVYAKHDNEWAKHYAQAALQMPFGHLRELKLTVIKCLVNARAWTNPEGRQIRHELRQLIQKIELR